MNDRPMCLYSAVSDPALFERVGFYRDDLAALATRSRDVRPINRLIDIWRLKPSVLLGYFYSKACLAAILARLVGARVILTGGADQISPALKSGLRLAAHRAVAFLCLCFAHRVVVSCDDDYQEFRRIACGFERLLGKISRAPHVVRPGVGGQGLNRQVDGHFHAFTICWLGSVANAKRKGVDRAINLVAALRGIGVDATLDVAGTTGMGLGYLERLASDSGVGSYVRFYGAISEDEKNRRFADGAVYLQLSRHEGFGVAAAEAFLSGMIVVHTNKGGLRDVIGPAGLVVDVEELLSGGGDSLRQFYGSYLSFSVNSDFLRAEARKYSIESRAQSLLG